MTVTKLSQMGAEFLIDKEGYVSKAYRDAVGVLTIGPGFTMGSEVFAKAWKAKHGRGLRMGDTLPRSEGLPLLRTVADTEYGPAVATKTAPKEQHHFDAAFSMTYNCGKGALDWKWAVALKDGLIKRAADLLRTTALTAKGVRLQGLVKRRIAEAMLLEHGQYNLINVAGSESSLSLTVEAIMEYQEQLQYLGYYSGSIDGDKGPLTEGAVKNFQRDKGLVVDGLVGPATRATLKRAVDAKRAGAVATGGGGAAGGGSLALPSFLDSPLTLVLVVAGVAATIWAGFWLWNNRGRWLYPVLDKVMPNWSAPKE